MTKDFVTKVIYSQHFEHTVRRIAVFGFPDNYHNLWTHDIIILSDVLRRGKIQDEATLPSFEQDESFEVDD